MLTPNLLMMTMKSTLAIFFLLTVLSKASNAQDFLTINALANSKPWLALLHIKPQASESDLISYVDDDSFFLATDGAINPKNELLSTISALKTQVKIQCKYPARTNFLLDNVKGLAEEVERVNTQECREYNDWREQLNTTSVVLVFAAAQLNSPSSMYGHTFLRFDPDNVEKNSTYLSYALNFGATVPDGDEGFLYAARGLTGGYPGNFAANPYFEKIKEYNQLENRDLWEYRLNLTQDEINTMLAHMWELKGVNFDYYFFDENCSFRLLELLDVARPGFNLVDNFPVTTMPLDTIRVVDDAGFVDDVFYRQSILTELENQLLQLSDTERQLVLALSEDENLLTSQQFTTLTSNKQQLIVDSAYRYLRYQNTFNGRQQAVTRRSFLLLRHMSKNPVTIAIDNIVPARPDKGHKTTMWGLGAGQRDEQSYLQLQYRGSYHDLLDPLAGYYSGMSLNMVNAIVRVYHDDKIKLEKAELLDIISLTPRNDFFKPWSWKANVSLEQQWTNGKERLITQGSGGGGVSYQPIDNSYVYLLGTARVEFNKNLDSFISLAPGINIGFLYNWQNAGLLIDAQYYQFLFDQTERTRVGIQQSWQLATNHSLRLSASYHKVENKLTEQYDFQEYKLEYRHYF